MTEFRYYDVNGVPAIIAGPFAMRFSTSAGGFIPVTPLSVLGDGVPITKAEFEELGAKAEADLKRPPDTD